MGHTSPSAPGHVPKQPLAFRTAAACPVQPVTPPSYRHTHPRHAAHTTTARACTHTHTHTHAHLCSQTACQWTRAHGAVDVVLPTDLTTSFHRFLFLLCVVFPVATENAAFSACGCQGEPWAGTGGHSAKGRPQHPLLHASIPWAAQAAAFPQPSRHMAAVCSARGILKLCQDACAPGGRKSRG